VELGRAARTQLQRQAEAEGREAVARTEAEALDAHRQQLQAELAVLGAQRDEREREEEAARRERAELQEQLDRARQARAEAERAHKKALIAHYRERKGEEDEMEAQRMLAEAAAAEQERLRQAEHNLERVQFRAEQLALSQQSRAAQREQERLRVEETHARLARVRDKALAAMAVTNDPLRAISSTAASAAPSQPKHELFRVPGYSEQTLMKDMRYKLGIALTNANLRHTEYGRQILNSMGAASRPDAVESSIRFG